MNSSHPVDVAVLRRPYGRTMPRDIRSVHMLALSFQDLKEQWTSFMRSSVSPHNGEKEVFGRKGRDLAERLSSQIKAIKQELLHHLSTLLHTRQAGTCSSKDLHTFYDTSLSRGNTSPKATTPTHSSTPQNDLPPIYKGDGNSDTVAFFTSLFSSREACVENCLEIPYLEALWLARRVWLWAIFIAILLADMELLSGSLSFATGLYFALPIPPGRGGNAPAFVMSSTSYSGYGALTYDTFRAYARRRGGGGVELVDFFDCDEAGEGDQAGETTQKKTNERAAAEGKEEEWDGIFLHAAVVLYAVLARDEAAAAGGIQRWWDALLATSDAQAGEASLAVTETPHPLLDAVDSNAKRDASEVDSPLRGGASQGGVENEEEVARLFAWRVALAAEFAAAEDYVSLNRLLRGAAFACRRLLISSPQSDRFHVNVAEGVSGSPRLSFSTSTCACFALQLLYRTLAEHVIRRQCIAGDLGKCFRPVISTEIPPSSGDNRSNFTFLTDCSPPSLDPPDEKPMGAADAKGSRSAQPSDHRRRVDVFLEQMHICSLIQLTSLRSKEGPWPLPKSLVSSAFNLVYS
ncbi:unnamed protein product [Phytomonas sp. EM1]|nr:unnamed protein product [Phytomonas sp. EM1]|eukprot:CCW60908.1 unnamed protein product [Phytomonas sp. isolate EM1]